MRVSSYLESRCLLQETLMQVGPSTQLLQMTVTSDHLDEWDASYALDMVSDVFAMVESLEEDGFFYFLSRLPGVAKEMKTVWSTFFCPHCQAPELQDVIGDILFPVFNLLYRLAPVKVYGILGHLKDFLQEAEEGETSNCLEHLGRIHQDLEEVQPESLLGYLHEFHQLLTLKSRNLIFLASLPSVTKTLGFPNLFDQLLALWSTLSITLDGCSWSLLELQDSLEELNGIQAVARFPGDRAE